MWSPPARSFWRRILAAFALLGVVPLVHAQDTWNGTTDSNWNTITNWSSNPTVPGSGNNDTAIFNNAGNGMTSITLGGATLTPGAIQFDTASVAAYTIGTTAGDTLSLASAGTGTTGGISVTSTVVNPQAINAAISFSVASPFITNASTTPAAILTLGSSGSPSTLTAASGTITVSAVTGATVTINDAITGSVAVTPNGTGTIQFMSGHSTYSGQTSINVTSGTVIQIGASSNAGGTAGPFGTSTLVSNSGNQTPLQAIGANQSIANPFSFTGGGFTISNAATPFNLALAGPISYTPIASKTLTFNTPGQTVTLGSSPTSPSTITLSNTASITLQMDTTLTGTLVINDVIQNNGATAGLVSYNSIGANTPEGVYFISGANTYSGGTGFGSQTTAPFGAANVLINVSSVGNPGSITSGPFGTGTITPNDSNAPPVLIPIGADRTVANAFTLTSGFFVGSATFAQDPVLRNLFLTGPITNTGKTITNNMMPGVALYLGTATTSSANTWTGTTTFQTQQSGTGAGTTVIYDTIAGTGAITVQNGATVQLFGANSYSGATKVTGGSLLINGTNSGGGAVSVTGGSLFVNGTNSGAGGVTATGAGTSSSAAGTGGTLGGTGTISNNITISSITSGSFGGIIAPGPGTSPGTLNTGTTSASTMTWNRFGQYTFQYNSNNTATGGGVNSFLNGTGTLNIGDLSNGPFNISLVPVNFSSTPTQQTYTLATFSNGIVNSLGAIANGTDVSSSFTVSGAFTALPAMYASVVGNVGGPQSLQMTFTPVPEPAFILAACGGLTALIGWRRSRRRASAGRQVSDSPC